MMTPLRAKALEEAAQHCQFHYTGPDPRPCLSCHSLAMRIESVLRAVVRQCVTTIRACPCGQAGGCCGANLVATLREEFPE